MYLGGRCAWRIGVVQPVSPGVTPLSVSRTAGIAVAIIHSCHCSNIGYSVVFPVASKRPTPLPTRTPNSPGIRLKTNIMTTSNGQRLWAVGSSRTSNATRPSAGSTVPAPTHGAKDGYPGATGCARSGGSGARLGPCRTTRPVGQPPGLVNLVRGCRLLELGEPLPPPAG